MAKPEFTNYGYFIIRSTKANERRTENPAIQMWMRFLESLAMRYSAIAATDDAATPNIRIMECIISPFQSFAFQGAAEP